MINAWKLSQSKTQTSGFPVFRPFFWLLLARLNCNLELTSLALFFVTTAVFSFVLQLISLHWIYHHWTACLYTLESKAKRLLDCLTAFYLECIISDQIWCLGQQTFLKLELLPVKNSRPLWMHLSIEHWTSNKGRVDSFHGWWLFKSLTDLQL
jgi:hypothetical protein